MSRKLRDAGPSHSVILCTCVRFFMVKGKSLCIICGGFLSIIISENAQDKCCGLSGRLKDKGG